MEIFSDIEYRLQSIFASWIKHVDGNTHYTLDDFPVDVGVVDSVTHPHCSLCVSINQCYFKNQVDKKPAESLHPHCHCRQLAINPTQDDLFVDISEGKLNFLLLDKIDWLQSMGYNKYDKKEIALKLSELARQSFFAGNYYRQKHDKHGFAININIDFLGKNEKAGRVYKLKTVYIIHPHGRLRNITPIGGWQK